MQDCCPSVTFVRRVSEASPLPFPPMAHNSSGCQTAVIAGALLWLWLDCRRRAKKLRFDAEKSLPPSPPLSEYGSPASFTSLKLEVLVPHEFCVSARVGSLCLAVWQSHTLACYRGACHGGAVRLGKTASHGKPGAINHSWQSCGFYDCKRCLPCCLWCTAEALRL